MLVRFGYVSHALSLWEASPARNVTFTQWKKLTKEERKEKLHGAAERNLKSTIRALHYNIAHEIPLYRMSSSLIPLATHPEVMWDYRTPFQELFQEIGALVKKHNLRVSFHPSQFTLFTSDKTHVTENAVKDMTYHYEMLEAMGLEKEAIINIHVGGAYGDKEKAIARFYKNLETLSNDIRKRMTLENDDKTYTAEETLHICEKTKIPMVFDYHHHEANISAVSYEELLPRIFNTWETVGLTPKVHLSSPKSESAFRHHAEHVSLEFAMPFFEALKKRGQNIDVMIEAKQKDRAMLQLVEELGKKRGFTRTKGGIITVKN
ncbi:UV DNA damage repair endonuclease UvsE [Bacillus taeanensis]|uniref:UV DNA damage endonuclease n=1 Tax=Bacillus taeanensis TaxID=273032 RepID=A0A366XV84_9BACI|nr:UV DNA damage repair endonuclease UvsE [Bacillus taeanensis]RBW68679.1 UV DNA damage repair endonuclease UvsE [Bacillus taeanensis]